MKSLRILYVEIDIFFVAAVIKVIFSLISLKLTMIIWLWVWERNVWNDLLLLFGFYFVLLWFQVRRPLIGSPDFFDQSELFAAPRKQNDKQFRYNFGTFHHSITQPRLSLVQADSHSQSQLSYFSCILSWIE